MNAVRGLLKGKKTYAVSLLILVQTLLPSAMALAQGGDVLDAIRLIDWRTVLEALGLSTLRAAISTRG